MESERFPVPKSAGQGLAPLERRGPISLVLSGLTTIRRAELAVEETSLTAALALRHALEAGGGEFIDEDGGGPGVRLRKLIKGLLDQRTI